MTNKHLDNRTRKAVYRREGFRCALCDSTRDLQLHHVVKLSQGGRNDPENLICLCGHCHALAHGRETYTMICGQRVDISMEDVEIACVEYLADLYAETEGRAWWPYEDGRESGMETFRDLKRNAEWSDVFQGRAWETLGF